MASRLEGNGCDRSEAGAEAESEIAPDDWPPRKPDRKLWRRR